MFTVSINSLPLPNMPLPTVGEDGAMAREQTFFEEHEALEYADILVAQGFIVRIEAPNRDDVIVCTGLIEVQREKMQPRALAELTDEIAAANMRRRRTA